MLQFGNRFLGKEIGYQRPVMLRFEVGGLHKERLAHIEGAVKVVILIPLVLHIVDIVVCDRVGKVELTEVEHEA